MCWRDWRTVLLVFIVFIVIIECAIVLLLCSCYGLFIVYSQPMTADDITDALIYGLTAPTRVQVLIAVFSSLNSQDLCNVEAVLSLSILV